MAELKARLLRDDMADPAKYVVVRDVPIFDEHDEHDKSGKLVRRFDRAFLQRIADKTNRRAEDTGDVALSGPGHTSDGSPEEDQPIPWGGYTNLRVRYNRAAGRHEIVADWHIARSVTTNNGRKVDGPEYVKTFPRRSVELWPGSWHIDWIAHLRRAPMRDVGAMTFSRAGKLCYSREGYMADEMDPTMEPDVNVVDDHAPDMDGDGDMDDMPPEGHEQFGQHLDYAMKKHPVLRYMCDQHAKYSAGEGGGAFLSATNPGLPPGVDDMDNDTPLRNARTEGDGVQPSRYAREIAEQKAKIASLERENRVARYSRVLDAVAAEGYEVDVAEELKDLADAPQDKFDRAVAKMRKCYSRKEADPTTSNLPGLLFREPSEIDPETWQPSTEVELDEVRRFQRQQNLPEGVEGGKEACRRYARKKFGVK